jgi:hypothetical protein
VNFDIDPNQQQGVIHNVKFQVYYEDWIDFDYDPYNCIYTLFEMIKKKYDHDNNNNNKNKKKNNFKVLNLRLIILE